MKRKLNDDNADSLLNFPILDEAVPNIQVEPLLIPNLNVNPLQDDTVADVDVTIDETIIEDESEPEVSEIDSFLSDLNISRDLNIIRDEPQPNPWSTRSGRTVRVPLHLRDFDLS